MMAKLIKVNILRLKNSSSSSKYFKGKEVLTGTLLRPGFFTNVKLEVDIGSVEDTFQTLRRSRGC